jgi:hypothetical protein
MAARVIDLHCQETGLLNHVICAPFPATVVRRRNCSVFHRARSQRAGGGLRLNCEDEPGRRATGKLLTRDEARRIAANIAKLPALLRGRPPKTEA